MLLYARVGPGMLHYILGITKAYCTRVGGGPFPTELDWEKPGTPGYHMSTVGAEKGVTTGRSRRCGWFDAASRFAQAQYQVNGLSGLCITKALTCSMACKSSSCVWATSLTASASFAHGGRRNCALQTDLRNASWLEADAVGVTVYEQLPQSARNYLERITQVTGVPIAMISTSPDRDHTIMMTHPYQAG